MSISLQNFNQIITDLARLQNIENYEVHRSSSIGKGDGFVGTMESVQLIGSNKRLDLVIKFASSNQKLHSFVPIHQAFLNEIKFYREIFPAFTDLQKLYGVERVFDNAPTFHASGSEPRKELLILDDLRLKNYTLCDRSQPMNRDHLENTFRVFAKFHGCSFAMKKLNPTKWTELTNDLNEDIFFQFTSSLGIFKAISVLIKDAVELFSTPNEDYYRKMLIEFSSVVEQRIRRSRMKNNCDVILHRDSWCNNIMYQYEDLNNKEIPKSIKLLDFQMLMLGSPAFDLVQFFYPSASKESLEDVDYFLKAYIEELGLYLKQYQLDVEEIFPYSTLKTHWRDVSPFALGLCFTTKKLIYIESDKVPNFIEDGENFYSKLVLTKENQKLYEKEIKELVKHFYGRKFL